MDEVDSDSPLTCPNLPDSLFIQNKLSSLIRYPLRPLKLPSTHRDKVELDPLSSDGLSHSTRYKPFIVDDPRVVGSKCQIICGYREIHQKRLRIRELCLLGGIHGQRSDDDDDLTEGHTNCVDISPFSDYLIARGGGSQEDSKSSKQLGKDKGQQQQGFSKGTKSKLKSWLTRNDNKKPVKKKPVGRGRNKKGPKGKVDEGPKDADNAETTDSQIPIEQDVNDKGHQTDASDLAKAETTIYIDINVIEKPVVEQDFLRVAIPEVEEEEKGFVLAGEEDEEDDKEMALDENEVLVPTILGGPDERDMEWLLLSSSDELEVEERTEADLLVKVHEKWMLRGISVESQNLVGAMNLFLKTSKYTGRSHFFTRPEYKERILEFAVDRRKEFIYFTTSIILWIILGLVTQATVDGVTNFYDDLPRSRNQTLREMLDVAFNFSSDDYSQRESQEFSQFAIPLVFMIGQLAIVALWSILVLLNYGLRMAHFFNTWSVALTEMEIDASKGIFLNIICNNLAFFIYAVLIITAFGTGTPNSVKGSMGIFTILLLRNLIPQVAATSDWRLTMYQVIGLIIHLYIMYCVRLVFNPIHIYAIALRNASELWNLKFALRLGQIPGTGASGYLKHLKIRQTLMKIWLHHRFLTGLCNQLGDIFVMPLMVSFFVELGIVIYVLTQLFKWAYDTREKSQIPSQLGDVCTALFVLAYIILDFMANSYSLASAGQAFRDGFEFVRRKGLILCNTSHERRLIQSLQWSFSATNATQVNLLGFFAVNWETMLSFMSIALLMWSLIIQLQQESKGAIVIYTPNCFQEPRGRRFSPDDDGFCRKKIWVPNSELDSRVEFITKNIKSLDVSLETKVRRRRRSDMMTSNPILTYLHTQLNLLHEKNQQKKTNPETQKRD